MVERESVRVRTYRRLANEPIVRSGTMSATRSKRFQDGHPAIYRWIERRGEPCGRLPIADVAIPAGHHRRWLVDALEFHSRNHARILSPGNPNGFSPFCPFFSPPFPRCFSAVRPCPPLLPHYEFQAFLVGIRGMRGTHRDRS